MLIFKTPKELQTFALENKRAGKSIALVPTMGFLHAGHMSLIDLARSKSDILIVSNFVNPIQFGVNEDLSSYPRNFEQDCSLCKEHGVDAVFAPMPEDMYEPNRSTYVNEEMLSNGFCGADRPGHFRGVTTVVAKLFNLALPDTAIFGQKDAQQALVIKRMVRDLNFPIEIIIAPLVRDYDNVALSSRNAYLSTEERERARILYNALSSAVSAIKAGKNIADVATTFTETIAQKADSIDYASICDAESLEAPTEATTKLILLTAARFGKTRLLDNMLVDLKQIGQKI